MATPPAAPILVTLEPAGMLRVDWAARDPRLALGARWHLEQEAREGYLPPLAWVDGATLAVAAPGDLLQAVVALVAWLRVQALEPVLAPGVAGARFAHGCGRRYGFAEWLARPPTRWPLAEGGWMDIRRCECGSDISLGGLVLIGPPAAG